MVLININIPLGLKMLMIMLMINVFAGLFSYGVNTFNQDVTLVAFENTTAGQVLQGGLGGELVINTSLVDVETADSVSADTGNVFTDLFKTVKSWFNKVDSSLGVITSILTQPMGLMRDLGVPLIVVNAFGVLWYISALFAVILLMRGY